MKVILSLFHHKLSSQKISVSNMQHYTVCLPCIILQWYGFHLIIFPAMIKGFRAEIRLLIARRLQTPKFEDRGPYNAFSFSLLWLLIFFSWDIWCQPIPSCSNSENVHYWCFILNNFREKVWFFFFCHM